MTRKDAADRDAEIEQREKDRRLRERMQRETDNRERQVDDILRLAGIVVRLDVIGREGGRDGTGGLRSR